MFTIFNNKIKNFIYKIMFYEKLGYVVFYSFMYDF